MIPARVDANPWIVLLVLTLGFFMILLDTTIVNIAIPDIEKGLSATFDQILWILNGYILVYAVLLITAGRMGDLYGPKVLFISGLVIFTLSSAACGLAQSPTQLIIFRVIQGAGGAILTPQTLSVITTIFPPERRGAAFGVWGAVGGVAAVVGPTLGGFLVTTASWRAIFYVNVPIGIIAVVAAVLLMPEIKSGRRHDLDINGVILASSGLFLIVFALIEGQRFSWGPITNFGSFSAGPTRWAVVSVYSLMLYGAILLLVFVYLEKRSDEPLLPLSLFSDRNYTVANIVSAGVSYAILSIFLPMTIFLQSILRFTAVHAGVTFIPMSAVSLVVAPIAGRLTDRINGKYVLMFGTACFAFGIALVIHTLALNNSSWDFVLPLMVAGLGMGCTFAPMVAMAMRDVNPSVAGSASGFLNTIRQIGSALGGAVGGAILGNSVAVELTVQANKAVAQVPPRYRASFLHTFHSLASKPQRFGTGQGSVPHAASGVPVRAAHQMAVLFREVFARAFLNGMRPSMIAAVVVLVGTAFAAGAMRGGKRPAGATEQGQESRIEAAG